MKPKTLAWKNVPHDKKLSLWGEKNPQVSTLSLGAALRPGVVGMLENLRTARMKQETERDRLRIEVSALLMKL